MADEELDLDDDIEDEDDALEPDLEAEDFDAEGFEGDEIDVAVEDDAAGDDEEDEPVVARPARKSGDEDEDEDEDEDGDDVEASLDVILKERLVVEDVEPDDEEDGAGEADDRHESRKVTPRRPDEFVCQSCFLVKHPSQLADKTAQLCRDCV